LTDKDGATAQGCRVRASELLELALSVSDQGLKRDFWMLAAKWLDMAQRLEEGDSKNKTN
jgi:hypothetical protein